VLSLKSSGHSETAGKDSRAGNNNSHELIKTKRNTAELPVLTVGVRHLGILQEGQSGV
jgi:hypothetical protein